MRRQVYFGSNLQRCVQGNARQICDIPAEYRVTDLLGKMVDSRKEN